MVHEEILLHKYYTEIKEMCYKDEPGAAIERWIKNTVDDDDSIPQDKKADYYVSDRKINAFKLLLQEQTKKMTLGLLNPQLPVVATDAKPADTKSKLDVDGPVKAILAKDESSKVIRMAESLMNLMTATQERYMALLQGANERGFSDHQEEKNIRGYLVEIRNQFEFLFKATGNEEFAKVMGAARAEQQVKGIMTTAKKTKLKEWARSILSDAIPELIPEKLSELEEILRD